MDYISGDALVELILGNPVMRFVYSVLTVLSYIGGTTFLLKIIWQRCLKNLKNPCSNCINIRSHKTVTNNAIRNHRRRKWSDISSSEDDTDDEDAQESLKKVMSPETGTCRRRSNNENDIIHIPQYPSAPPSYDSISIQ